MSLAAAPDPALPYVDRKRHAWVLALAGLGPVLYGAWPHMLMLWLPVIFVYCVAPLIDLALGADTSNPPEHAVPRLEADLYYRYVTYALVPLLWAAFVYGAWSCVRRPLPWDGRLAVVMTTGMVGGFCINLGHEMGHKKSRLERWLAKIVLAPTFYGHFAIEHNRGHHRDVATAADPASSRTGEGIWTFVLREMPGAFRRAWQLERARMNVDSLPFWSLHNELLQPALITTALWTSLALWLGPNVLVFLVLAFALMDARLAAAVHSHATRINFSPRRRAALIRRHGLVDFPAATPAEGAHDSPT